LVALPCKALELQRPLGVIYRRGATLGASSRVFLDLVLSDAGIETAVMPEVVESTGVATSV